MEELIQKSTNGDQDAYIKLINMIKNDLYRVAQARLNNIDDINDAIHETILKSYNHLNKLKEPKYFKTWIIKILINECNNVYRKRKRQSKLIKKISKEKELKTCDDVIDNVNSKLDFYSMLKDLTYEEKIIIVLYFNSGYKIREIAEILNENENTIKSRFLRARKKLKESRKGGIADE